MNQISHRVKCESSKAMGIFQMPSLVVIVVTMFLLVACCKASSSPQLPIQDHTHKMLNASASSPVATGGGGGVHSSRRVDVYGCSEPEELVTVAQNSDVSLHSGMPAYTVEITNNCIDCTLCDVHLSSGDFANSELVDPATFCRLGFDDCLVKDGGPILPSEMIIFQYANSFLYVMKVVSAACNCA